MIIVHEVLILKFVNSLECMGKLFVFSIFTLEHFENYAMFGKLGNLDKLGKGGAKR